MNIFIQIILYFLVMGLIFAGCAADGFQQKLNKIVYTLENSRNANEEREQFKKLLKFNKKNKSELEVFSIDENNNQLDINDIKNIPENANVLIIISRSMYKKEIKHRLIDSDNIFILFRE